MNLNEIIKYPRTQHLSGSRLQVGDEDLSQVQFSEIQNKYIVIEEKVDGANTGISFDKSGSLLLQSRGHYLTGGYRERHYDLFKQWAYAHCCELYKILGTRYILYGEWLYAKHTIFYDMLPHYFMEFDIYDKENRVFLSTLARKRMLAGSHIVSVPVLSEGRFGNKEQVLRFIGKSLYRSDHVTESLMNQALSLGLNPEQVIKETDTSNLMEGIYIKVETDMRVIHRLKYVRHAFIQSMTDSDTHWIDRPIVPNVLSVPVESLFGG